ncbi:hypothetical protein FOZ60_008043 [Perkinsus olseni]|uniref:C2H2-type domain-containing protein n=1 Tax=Perkinsus olseni TaxID=32597 RepID=A0A7J6PEA6_PEROL|nr:hypothetical protein FOZ60_008043 [Perkinsus olseni]
MNTMMWDNPFTREHLKVCVSTMGFRVIMPISKTLVCGDTGLGAMAEPRDIAAAVLTAGGSSSVCVLLVFWRPSPSPTKPAVMGRKNKHSEGGSKIFRPFCYYCERDFDDEKVLIQHQKIKHFKCSTCQRKLDTASGLVAHMLQVHRETLNKWVKAQPWSGENPDLQIRGMENVPMGMILDKAKGSDMENFYMRKHMEQKHDALPPPPPRPAGGLPFMPGAGPRGQTPPPGGMPGLGAPPTPPMPPFFMAHGGQPTSSSTNQPVASQQQPTGLPQPPMGVPTPPPFPGFPSQPASTAAPGVVAAAAPMSFPAPLGMPPPSSSPPTQDDTNKQFGNQASSAAAAAAAAAATAAARLQGAFSGRSRSRSRSPRRNYTTSDGTPSAGQGVRLVHGSGHLAGITLTSYQDDLQKGDQVCFEEMRALAMLSATGQALKFGRAISTKESHESLYSADCGRREGELVAEDLRQSVNALPYMCNVALTDIDISVVKVAQTGDTRGVRNISVCQAAHGSSSIAFSVDKWTKEVSTTEFQCNNYNWLHDMFDGGLQMIAIDGIYYDAGMILKSRWISSRDLRIPVAAMEGVGIEVQQMAYDRKGNSLTFAFNTRSTNFESVDLKCGSKNWWHDPITRVLIEETITGLCLIVEDPLTRISDVIASSTLETVPIMTRQFCGDATVNLQRLSVAMGYDSIIDALCAAYRKCSEDPKVEKSVCGQINRWVLKGRVH